MTTTKIIANIIYFAGMLAALLLDLDNWKFYLATVLVVIQVLFIVSEYIITSRIIPNEVFLVKKDSPFVFKNLLPVIALNIGMLVGFNLLFKPFTTKYLVILISIVVLSGFIQFFIIRGKNTASLLINENNLLLNDLLLKSYNLETLKKVTLDSFEKKYIAEFANSKKIEILQDDYNQGDLTNFVNTMIEKSNRNIALVTINNETNIPAIDIANS